MKIGFDASQAGALRAGCGQVAYCLLKSLGRLDKLNDYLIYTGFGHYREANPLNWPRPFSDRQRLGPLFPGFGAAQRFFSQPGPDFENRLGRPDIVHSNNFFCPQGLKRAKLLYFLHDLSFLEYPDQTSEANRVSCFEGVFQASLAADMVVANSDFTRQHFLRTFPHYPKERTLVAQLASRFEGKLAVAKPWPGLEPGRYWLSVGTIEPRKNQLRLLEAYSRLAPGEGGDYPLVLAGGKGWLMPDFKAKVAGLGLEKRVVLTGYLRDEPLAWLYQNCLAFVYPSLFEGFGLPVLEAMSQGAAVITSNCSALPEVAGEAALLVDPYNIDELAQAMRSLALNSALREACRVKGESRAAQFSWDKMAAEILSCYLKVMELPKLAV